MVNLQIAEETVKWKAGVTIPSKFKAALRVDPLLSGNWDAVKGALVVGGYDASIEGAKKFLRDWAKTMKPIYLMASTPAGFSYGFDFASLRRDLRTVDGCGRLPDQLPPSRLLESSRIPAPALTCGSASFSTDALPR